MNRTKCDRVGSLFVQSLICCLFADVPSKCSIKCIVSSTCGTLVGVTFSGSLLKASAFSGSNWLQTVSIDDISAENYLRLHEKAFLFSKPNSSVRKFSETLLKFSRWSSLIFAIKMSTTRTTTCEIPCKRFSMVR